MQTTTTHPFPQLSVGLLPFAAVGDVEALDAHGQEWAARLNFNVRGADGESLLHLAARGGHVDFTRKLHETPALSQNAQRHATECDAPLPHGQEGGEGFLLGDGDDADTDAHGIDLVDHDQASDGTYARGSGITAMDKRGFTPLDWTTDTDVLADVCEVLDTPVPKRFITEAWHRLLHPPPRLPCEPERVAVASYLLAADPPESAVTGASSSRHRKYKGAATWIAALIGRDFELAFALLGHAASISEHKSFWSDLARAFKGAPPDAGIDLTVPLPACAESWLAVRISEELKVGPQRRALRSVCPELCEVCRGEKRSARTDLRKELGGSAQNQDVIFGALLFAQSSLCDRVFADLVREASPWLKKRGQDLKKQAEHPPFPTAVFLARFFSGKFTPAVDKLNDEWFEAYSAFYFAFTSPEMIVRTSNSAAPEYTDEKVSAAFARVSLATKSLKGAREGQKGEILKALSASPEMLALDAKRRGVDAMNTLPALPSVYFRRATDALCEIRRANIISDGFAAACLTSGSPDFLMHLRAAGSMVFGRAMSPFVGYEREKKSDAGEAFSPSYEGAGFRVSNYAATYFHMCVQDWENGHAFQPYSEEAVEHMSMFFHPDKPLERAWKYSTGDLCDKGSSFPEIDKQAFVVAIPVSGNIPVGYRFPFFESPAEVLVLLQEGTNTIPEVFVAALIDLVDRKFTRRVIFASKKAVRTPTMDEICFPWSGWSCTSKTPRSIVYERPHCQDGKSPMEMAAEKKIKHQDWLCGDEDVPHLGPVLRGLCQWISVAQVAANEVSEEENMGMAHVLETADGAVGRYFDLFTVDETPSAARREQALADLVTAKDAVENAAKKKTKISSSTVGSLECATKRYLDPLFSVIDKDDEEDEKDKDDATFAGLRESVFGAFGLAMKRSREPLESAVSVFATFADNIDNGVFDGAADPLELQADTLESFTAAKDGVKKSQDDAEQRLRQHADAVLRRLSAKRLERVRDDLLTRVKEAVARKNALASSEKRLAELIRLGRAVSPENRLQIFPRRDSDRKRQGGAYVRGLGRRTEKDGSEWLTEYCDLVESTHRFQLPAKMSERTGPHPHFDAVVPFSDDEFVAALEYPRGMPRSVLKCTAGVFSGDSPVRRNTLRGVLLALAHLHANDFVHENIGIDTVRVVMNRDHEKVAGVLGGLEKCRDVRECDDDEKSALVRRDLVAFAHLSVSISWAGSPPEHATPAQGLLDTIDDVDATAFDVLSDEMFDTASKTHIDALEATRDYLKRAKGEIPEGLLHALKVAKRDRKRREKETATQEQDRICDICETREKNVPSRCCGALYCQQCLDECKKRKTNCRCGAVVV